jgi:LmbE family N-acetylglucosaminyl deacetylase
MLSARRLEATPLARARWIVLAPHADDETLGCGALIANAAERGVLAGVVILTDGAGSHSHSDHASRARLIAARRHEATLAMRRLAGTSVPTPIFLGWPDAHPYQPGSAAFERTCHTLGAICRRERVDAMAVTAQHEPHCDHEAAFQVAHTVAATAIRRIMLYEYIVWADGPPTKPYRAVRTRPMALGRRNQALAAHRSQISPLFGEGFRLSPAKMRMPACDVLYERVNRHAGQR